MAVKTRRLPTLGAGVLLVAGPICGMTGAKFPVVDRAIEFHGGSAFTRTTTAFTSCSGSGCSRVRVTRRGGLFEHEVQAEIGGVERRVRTTNESVELWQDGIPVAVADGVQAQKLRDWAMQRIYFSFLPFRLNDPSVIKEDFGLVDWRRRMLHQVKVTFEAGSSTDAQDEYLYWFDPRTARLEMFAYSYEVDGGGLRFRRLFNYRRVGELLFYDQENWGVDGPGLAVELITPEFVDRRMRRVSTILLSDIEVEPLAN